MTAPGLPAPTAPCGPPGLGAASAGPGFSLSLRVGSKPLTQFTRQFAMLLEAGLPIVRSLEVLFLQLSPGLLRQIVAQIKADVENGAPLSEALARHPATFDQLYVHMVKAGEAAGLLDQILSRLADYMEKSQRLKQKIIGALVYPAAVIFIAGSLLALIMIFIVPKFEALFLEMQLGQMPLLTAILLETARTCRNGWYLWILLPLLLWLATRRIAQNPRGRLVLDLLKLKAPLFGLLVSKSCISRTCRTLGTLLQAGVPILNALSILKHTTGNAVIAGAVENVHDSIREGDSIAEPLRHSGVFDVLVVNMIQVGEETGELEQVLLKVADTYDGEVDALAGSLLSLLEPFLIVALGLTVGFIVIALFLPLFTIMTTLGGG